MDTMELISGLTSPDCYAHKVEKVEVRQTHISIVFLAGPFVYKIKKPVDFGFLDFTTLEKRRHFCNQEIRLNRRLAPSVYLDVIPVTKVAGRLRFGGGGEVVEWAVKMLRLPDDATLQARLKNGQVTAELMAALGKRIAHFHRHAQNGPEIAAFGHFEIIAQNSRENFEQSLTHVNHTVSCFVFDRLKLLTDENLTRLRPLIESRAEHLKIRDTHGDLHTDHVYVMPDRNPPDDLMIIDCIEFNERFRFADPIADMAFLYMDLKFHGQEVFADAFAEAYFREADDNPGRQLLAFYSAYRAIVRAKVDGFKLAQPEIPDVDRRQAISRAKGLWLLALRELEGHGRRPCLILIGGLPGTGKSTLAQALAARTNCHLIRSDLIRKELAGLGSQPAPAAFGQGIYSSEWTDRTYDECLRRARNLIFDGQRVIIDANFGQELRRRAALDLAREYCVPAVFFHCVANPEVIGPRLEYRKGDPSDADWSVYEKAANRWEPLGPATEQAHCSIDTNNQPDQALQAAIRKLQLMGLVM